MIQYGATAEEWSHFSEHLGLTADLLPVVSNPHARIDEQSRMKAAGKTPSIYTQDGTIKGLPNWTDIHASPAAVNQWSRQPDYGICIQTRHVRAIDIDVGDEAQVKAIVDTITAQLDIVLPQRWRDNSSKILLPFRFNRPMTKRVIPVQHGMIEFLADGQQFIAAGTHPSGSRYQWDMGGPPASIPVLTETEFENIWNTLVLDFAVGTPRIARERRVGQYTGEVKSDPVAAWLAEHWEVYDEGRDHQLYLRCPFEAEHTSDSGPSATAYFPAGTGGYERGHFVCLHAHCQGRTDNDFLDATGYNVAQFEDLGDVPAVSSAEVAGTDLVPTLQTVDWVDAQDRKSDNWPNLSRNTKSRFEPTADNLTRAIGHGGMIYMKVCYDAFTDNLVYAPYGSPPGEEPWRNFSDAETVKVRRELERRGFEPMGEQLLRGAIHAAARSNTIDTAKEWLARQTWDGVPRIERFCVDVWGWNDTPYSRAVGRYVWTALAGRIIQPGVRADMAPILTGLQGLRKTTAIQSMVPHEDMYAEIKLDERDADMSRKLRGKLVGELEELRGLNSRAVEEIKAFVSRRREAWVPKFKEFENFFWRRCLLIGTTNDDEMLADPTGERRWLPGRCVRPLNIELLIETREQLWAEGAILFQLDGVQWQEAEQLARQEHHQFKISDTWERRIRKWLIEPAGVEEKTPLEKGYVTADEVLCFAIGMQYAQHNRGHEIRVGKALRHLGFVPVEHETEGRVWKMP